VNELATINESAARSLEEGIEDTLTLHRLHVVVELGVGCKTTSLIESVMARVDAKTRRVARCRSRDQKQRWCAATLLQLEPRFRRVKGANHLPLLQAAIRPKLSVHTAA